MIDTPARTQIPVSALDTVLTAQFAIAWAGEGGEEKRLAWWRTDLHSEYGGLDLYQRLLPNTAEWAVFQSLRETARRKDAELRGEAHDAEELISLFSLASTSMNASTIDFLISNEIEWHRWKLFRD